jgi:hypothetical protein
MSDRKLFTKLKAGKSAIKLDHLVPIKKSCCTIHKPQGVALLLAQLQILRYFVDTLQPRQQQSGRVTARVSEALVPVAKTSLCINKLGAGDTSFRVNR